MCVIFSIAKKFYGLLLHFDEVESSFLFGGPIQSLETESANLRFARPVS